MDFGLFSNYTRYTRPPWEGADEDLFELITADRLGVREAWISEHTYPAELIIARAAPLTDQIRMGPGIRPLILHAPYQMVVEANACDQLTKGRYMFGYGLGGPALAGTRLGQRGFTQDMPKREMLHEALDFILQCWQATEPFDFEGTYYRGWGIDPQPKPYQKPHPPIGVASVAARGTVEVAGKHGFMPLFAQYDTAPRYRDAQDAYCEAALAAGRTPSLNEFRMCRFVYVADTDKQARDDLRESFHTFLARDRVFAPHHYEHHLPASGRIEDVTFDHLCDIGEYIVGDPTTVHDLIKKYYDDCRGFGVFLLLMGKDWGTREGRARSMEMFMQEVAPRLRPLDPDADYLDAVIGQLAA